MTIVLVHGNPETDAVWEPLGDGARARRHPTPVRLSPPGFGAPLPDGFDVTPEGYRAWLAGELERIGGPVDLVGHDWGGIHVVNVAITRPDLLRSWATDAIGVFHPDYVWHPLAQIWQSAGARAKRGWSATSTGDRSAERSPPAGWMPPSRARSHPASTRRWATASCACTALRRNRSWPGWANGSKRPRRGPAGLLTRA